jgi:hypothetical protein
MYISVRSISDLATPGILAEKRRRKRNEAKKTLGSLELNRIYQRDCLEGMALIEIALKEEHFYRYTCNNKRLVDKEIYR